MDILVINGGCLTENTSANLCHSAYIRGLIDAGHTVDLISASEKDMNVDKSIQLPPVNSHFTYYGVTLYEKLAHRSKSKLPPSGTAQSQTNNTSSVRPKKTFIASMKKSLRHFVRQFYGVHQLSSRWYKNAKAFKSDKNYDCVISIAYPPVSHRLAETLIAKNRIKCKRWIEIWEDPWNNDLACRSSGKVSNAKLKEEHRLLKKCDKVIYVSPLTLKYQKEDFSDCADKMDWCPLPMYYESTPTRKKNGDTASNVYGYFGDYPKFFRDLEPFYRAAVQSGIEVNICGNPSNMFPSDGAVHISPRIPLHELKKIEEKTNVIVFLCNSFGGQIPGKIYQYASTDKTVLFILDGKEDEKKVIKDYFAKFNRFVFCENTVESISQAIQNIESNNIGNVVNTPLDEFNPQKIAQQLLNLCDK